MELPAYLTHNMCVGNGINAFIGYTWGAMHARAHVLFYTFFSLSFVSTWSPMHLFSTKWKMPFIHPSSKGADWISLNTLLINCKGFRAVPVYLYHQIKVEEKDSWQLSYSLHVIRQHAVLLLVGQQSINTDYLRQRSKPYFFLGSLRPSSQL
jgi:hypothetical protein